MQLFESIDQMRHTAIYVRISTASQKTDRQQEELTSYAELNQLNFNRNLDVFIDVISGFKDGEISEYSVTLNRLRNEMSDLSRRKRSLLEIKDGRTVGRYNFTEFDQLVKDRGMVSEFSPYKFKVEKE